MTLRTLPRRTISHTPVPLGLLSSSFAAPVMCSSSHPPARAVPECRIGTSRALMRAAVTRSLLETSQCTMTFIGVSGRDLRKLPGIANA
eukprot:482546-Alexandrium_andersonii.AAC.1